MLNPPKKKRKKAPDLGDDPVTGPKATADQIYGAATGLQASLDKIQLGRIATGDPNPPARLDARKSAVVLAVCQSLRMSTEPATAQVQQELKVDPSTLPLDVIVQTEAHGAALEAQRLNQGAKDARRVVGASRQLGQILVKGEVQRQLSSRDALGRELLNAHYRPVQIAEDAQIQDSTSTGAATRQRNLQTAQKLEDVNARKQLQQVLAALSAGQSIAWDTLVSAAKTLDQIVAEESGVSTPTSVATGDRRTGAR